MSKKSSVSSAFWLSSIHPACCLQFEHVESLDKSTSRSYWKAILDAGIGAVWSSSIAKDLEADVVFLQQRLANLQSQNGCASHGRPEIGARLNQFAGRYSEFMEVVLYGSLLSVLFKETRSRLRSSWSQQPRSLIDIPLENLCWQLPAADFMALSMAGGLV